MAGIARPMSQIKQLLRLHQQHSGDQDHCPRKLGISKNTVKSYLSELCQINWSIQELLLLGDPVWRPVSMPATRLIKIRAMTTWRQTGLLLLNNSSSPG